ncbi:acetate--CoA ligase [Terribacillus sp. 179-K 1B1 HS]|uniref:acetate--CoA ligase n=1 Tax=Terribacillus sp. 179-K 1B1 HS TaxID=3142388 RepID=UPI00399F5308
MKMLAPLAGKHNVSDFEALRQSFEWSQMERDFSWFNTGKLNAAYEAVDRHAENPAKADQLALIYQDGETEEKWTFKQMKERSNQAANMLKALGVTKGDRVFLFMPRCPDFYASFFGILKNGAVAGPLFEAFMEQAVEDRLKDSGASVLITTAELLPRVNRAELPDLEAVIVLGCESSEGLHDYTELMDKASTEFEPVWLDKEDGMLLHYTSGSTGKPKGVYHAHRAMIQHYATGKWILDLQEDDVYWCTADPGWVTGTSYGIFAPWLNGATNVIAGGRFTPEAWYKIIEKHKVTVWYTAPTALRKLAAAGDEVARSHDMSSLRHVLSVGEPLNPEIIYWAEEVYGKRIHDTWWMTETGAMLIVNHPTLPIKPGAMGKPIPGVEAAIIDDAGNVLPPHTSGNLAVKAGWPSMMKTIWGNQEKFDSYFINGWYVSGDSAKVDEEGYFWFEGRLDDVINTSGKLVGPFEVESKLIEHPAVTEAAVIGKPDEERGEIIKAFITLDKGHKDSMELREELRLFIKKGLSAHAAPREIEIVTSIPKTRSGKIMRRLLRAKELGLPLGDTSTLEE